MNRPNEPTPILSHRRRPVEAHIAHLVDALCNSTVEAVVDRLSLVDTFRVSASPYMTIPEAAEYGRMPKQRLYDLRSDGTLGAYGDGRKALVLRDELDSYLRKTARAG